MRFRLVIYTLALCQLYALLMLMHPSCSAAQEIINEIGIENENGGSDELLVNLTGLLDKRTRAQDVVNTILELPYEQSSTVPYQLQLARAFLQVGRSKEAEIILLQCYEESPSYVEVARLLGSYYVQGQRWNEAEMYLKRTITMDPSNWKALAGLGKIYLIRDEDKYLARNYLQEAVHLQPNDENLLFEYAMILFHFEDHLPARHALQAAENLNPVIDHKVK